MKNVSSMMKRVSLMFLISIIIIGNDILSPHIALGAEKKSITMSDEREVLHKSNDEIINDEYNNDELFEGYLNKLFYGDNSRSSDFGLSNFSPLNENEKLLYTKLKDIIAEIADGKRKETIFTIDTLKIYSNYEFSSQISPTKDEILQNFFTNELNIDKILDVLLSDCTYELYWYKKSKGTDYTYNYSYSAKEEFNITKIDFTLNKITFKFQVASDYAEDAGNNKYYTYRIDDSKVKRAQTAKVNVDSIIKKYMNLDDYNKLYAYMNEICKLVEYDYRAAGNGDLWTINDPWQLISVFDNDDTTNVVCEGYSKAFAYLCEKSNFQNVIKCYIVTGVMKTDTEGGHMWNIVTMENGKNYFVDITNCDGNGIGSTDQLFLAGLSGNIDNGFVFTNKNGYMAYYTYYDDTKQLYPKSILEISDTDYRPTEELPVTTPETPSIPEPTIKPEPEVPNDEPNFSVYIGMEVASGNANYKVISTDGVISVQFTGVKKKSNNVVIPATIKVNNKNYKVTEIAKNAMKNDKTIKKLTIGKNIVKIGSNAFYSCKNLKNIKIQSKKLTANKIGKNAFKGINANVSVEVPSGMLNKYKKVIDKIL